MTQNLKLFTYNLITIWLHPALGGFAMFTIAGVLFDLVANPLALVFVFYVVAWCIICDFLQFLGWDRS